MKRRGTVKRNLRESVSYFFEKKRFEGLKGETGLNVLILKKSV